MFLAERLYAEGMYCANIKLSLSFDFGVVEPLLLLCFTPVVVIMKFNLLLGEGRRMPRS